MNVGRAYRQQVPHFTPPIGVDEGILFFKKPQFVFRFTDALVNNRSLLRQGGLGGAVFSRSRTDHQVNTTPYFPNTHYVNIMEEAESTIYSEAARVSESVIVLGTGYMSF